MPRHRYPVFGLLLALGAVASASDVAAQTPPPAPTNDAPNPYRTITG